MPDEARQKHLKGLSKKSAREPIMIKDKPPGTPAPPSTRATRRAEAEEKSEILPDGTKRLVDKETYERKRLKELREGSMSETTRRGLKSEDPTFSKRIKTIRVELDKSGQRKWLFTPRRSDRKRKLIRRKPRQPSRFDKVTPEERRKHYEKLGFLQAETLKKPMPGQKTKVEKDE